MLARGAALNLTSSPNAKVGAAGCPPPRLGSRSATCRVYVYLYVSDHMRCRTLNYHPIFDLLMDPRVMDPRGGAGPCRLRSPRWQPTEPTAERSLSRTGAQLDGARLTGLDHHWRVRAWVRAWMEARRPSSFLHRLFGHAALASLDTRYREGMGLGLDLTIFRKTAPYRAPYVGGAALSEEESHSMYTHSLALFDRRGHTQTSNGQTRVKTKGLTLA